MADNNTPNRAANEDKAEGEDVVNRDERDEPGQETPRRYDQPADDAELPVDAIRPNPQI